MLFNHKKVSSTHRTSSISPPPRKHVHIVPSQLFFSLLLCFLLFSNIFSGWPFPVPPAFAAQHPSPIPPSLTFQKFLHETRHDGVSRSSFVHPSTIKLPPMSARERASNV